MQSKLIDAQAVSIHAPREGCDWSVDSVPSKRNEFQFTHPGRGATLTELIIVRRLSSFNSRTPGGVRLFLSFVLGLLTPFQFTHPGRGATRSRLP